LAGPGGGSGNVTRTCTRGYPLPPVTGINLAHRTGDETPKKLCDTAVENVGLVVSGQEHPTSEQLHAAGEIFGELIEDQNRRYLVSGFPLNSVLDNRHKDSKG